MFVCMAVLVCLLLAQIWQGEGRPDPLYTAERVPRGGGVENQLPGAGELHHQGGVRLNSHVHHTEAAAATMHPYHVRPRF